MAEHTTITLPNAIESVLLVASEPLSPRTLARLFDVDERSLTRAVDQLRSDLVSRGIRLQEHNGLLQLITAPENADVVREFLRVPRQPPLTGAALETLAIVAYKQPVTRSEIERFRGVNADRLIGRLLGRGLIEETGRRPTIGRPVEYSTTDEFLKLFGLSSRSDLPASHLEWSPEPEKASSLGMVDDTHDTTSHGGAR